MAKQLFDAKRSNIFFFDPDDLIVIGLDTTDGPEHPLYDARAKLPVDDKLVLNIMALGKILEPVGVRKNGEIVEVIYGRQRVKACREANKRLKASGCEPIFVPAIGERVDNSRAFGMMISENELRRGDAPLTKAQKLQKYIDLGHTEKDASEIFGITLQTAKNWLSLLDLDRSVQKMVESGKITATAAAGLVSLSREKQKEEAEKLISDGKATITEVKHAVKKVKEGGDVLKAPSKKELKRLLAADEVKQVLDAGFIAGVRFCLGLYAPDEDMIEMMRKV